MAQKYLDMMDQKKARTFKDFEEEWVALGEELCVAAFEPENSPKEDENESDQPRKRKLSETEDSYVLNQRRLKQQKLTNEKRREDGNIISNLRKRDPLRLKKLKERVLTVNGSLVLRL
uniref:Uncharacterized protein n=1 Tax=Magallana gigas TaxID=29159 RepID=A0A8W8P1A4_MAGGI